MNIFILKFLLSIIVGICLGLYFKNIALFVYILIFIILLANYKKTYFKLKKNILFIVFSIIIFLFVNYFDNKFENLYKENIDIYGVGEIISFAEEKEYKNKYIIKIKKINNDNKYKNTKLIFYADKNINLEYGDIIYFYNCNFEKALGQRNDKGFNYERYLRQSKIYGILNIGNFEIKFQEKGIRYKFFKFKENMKKSLYEMYQSENAGFLSGLLLR